MRFRICERVHGPFPPATRDCPECGSILPVELYDADEARQRLEAMQGPVPPPPPGGMMLDTPWGLVTVDQSIGLGRGEDFSPFSTQISKADPQCLVSRRHATLRVADGRFVIRDNGSKNHTFVNGQKIGGEPVALADGDVVYFGPHFHFMVRYP